MLQINSEKKGPAVVTTIKMSGNVPPEEHYDTFIAVAISFAEVMAGGARANGLEVTQNDVIQKMAEDLLKKCGAGQPAETADC